MKRLFIAIIAFLGASFLANAQVGVYPQVVFLDPSSRATSITLTNSSPQIKEVSISLKFGYPSFDSTGKSFLNYQDSVTEKQYSLAPYLKIFPKKIILKGNEEQTIRIVLGNIADLNDGFYFTRFEVLSQDPKKQVDTTDIKEGQLKASFDMRFVVVGLIMFKKGKPDCSVNIKGCEVVNDTNGMRLILDYERGGAAPFYGTTIIKAVDQDGATVQEFGEMTPVYFNCKKSFKLDESKYTPGNMYNFQIIMTNEHRDIPDSYRIPFEPYVHTVSAMVKSKL